MESHEIITFNNQKKYLNKFYINIIILIIIIIVIIILLLLLSSSNNKEYFNNDLLMAKNQLSSYLSKVIEQNNITNNDLCIISNLYYNLYKGIQNDIQLIYLPKNISIEIDIEYKKLKNKIKKNEMNDNYYISNLYYNNLIKIINILILNNIHINLSNILYLFSQLQHIFNTSYNVEEKPIILDPNELVDIKGNYFIIKKTKIK